MKELRVRLTLFLVPMTVPIFLFSFTFSFSCRSLRVAENPAFMILCFDIFNLVTLMNILLTKCGIKSWIKLFFLQGTLFGRMSANTLVSVGPIKVKVLGAKRRMGGMRFDCSA